jgi:hypothetical protein
LHAPARLVVSSAEYANRGSGGTAIPIRGGGHTPEQVAAIRRDGLACMGGAFHGYAAVIGSMLRNRIALLVLKEPTNSLREGCRFIEGHPNQRYSRYEYGWEKEGSVPSAFRVALRSIGT